MARVFGTRALVRVPIFDDRWLTVGLYDSYWLPLALRGDEYEPEIAAVLRAYLEPGATFVDCGANVGWWSIFATRHLDANRVISVEAASPVFEILRLNASEHGQEFTCHHAAAWHEAGADVPILTDLRRHAWSSTDPRIGSELERYGFLKEMVRTVTVDDLVGTAIDAGGRVVLKIDVEGAEREVLGGAVRALQADTVVIYEDHGRDAASQSTSYLLERGLEIFRPMPNGALQPVHSAQHATSLKHDTAHGYNFVAIRPGSRAHRHAVGRLEATP